MEGYGFESPRKPVKQLPGTLWIWGGQRGSRGDAAESVSGEASTGDGVGGGGRVRLDAGTTAALNTGE